MQTVAIAFKPTLGGKGAEVIGNFFFVVGRVRNGADVLKKMKNGCRLAVLDEIGHSDFPFGNG